MKKDTAQHKLAERLSLPPETLAELPVICLKGSRSICIENHRGITAYAPDCVIVEVKGGNVTVYGQSLSICSMTRICLELRGRIYSVETNIG